VIDNVWLETRGGYAFTRYLHLADDHLNHINRDLDPKGALLLQIGLAFGER
jgi:hypothetical protein